MHRPAIHERPPGSSKFYNTLPTPPDGIHTIGTNAGKASVRIFHGLCGSGGDSGCMHTFGTGSTLKFDTLPLF